MHSVPVTSVLELSLICPLGHCRLVTPARGRRCAHLSCFELKAFLGRWAREGNTACPLCGWVPCHRQPPGPPPASPEGEVSGPSSPAVAAPTRRHIPFHELAIDSSLLTLLSRADEVRLAKRGRDGRGGPTLSRPVCCVQVVSCTLGHHARTRVPEALAWPLPSRSSPGRPGHHWPRGSGRWPRDRGWEAAPPRPHGGGNHPCPPLSTERGSEGGGRGSRHVVSLHPGASEGQHDRLTAAPRG